VELYFDIAGNQILGARDYQEDAFLITYLDDDSGDSKSTVLAIVADGMGGHAAGNIAANLVVSTFNAIVTKDFGKQEIPALLRAGLMTANEGLRKSVQETPALDGMGCTMVSIVAAKKRLWWISVGDSHLYLLRDRELIKQNADHSYGGYIDRMKAQGLDVAPDPSLSRHMLMSAVTGDEIAEIDCPQDGLLLRGGDRLVLASDGLDTINAETIIKSAAWSKSAKGLVDGLLKAVEDADRSRQDNTTVVVIDVLERRAPPPVKTPPLEGSEPPSATPQVSPDNAAERESSSAAPEAFTEQPSPDTTTDRLSWWRKTPGVMIAGTIIVIVLLIGTAIAFFAGRIKDHDAVISQGVDDAPVDRGVLPSQTGAQAPSAERPAQSATPTSPEAMPKPASEPKSVQQAMDKDEQDATATALGQGSGRDTFRDPLASGGGGPLMAKLPGRTFEMGASKLSINADERPPHRVTVAPFAISQHEISVREYLRFATATGHGLPKPLAPHDGDYPIHNVTWNDANQYARWLSKETGRDYRLPSEAEWEYAASAGTTTPYWWGNGPEPNMAHCQRCSPGLNPEGPIPVGQFPPNPFGLYDTAGNVAEWVYDCYHPSYHGAPDTARVWNAENCTYRVVRGGSFHSAPPGVRPASRDKRRPAAGYGTVGFRIARSL
jgi:formylglycine-generating enzyme required for sulfatase activity/serine/threonine protein phosphatase PrpC